MTMEGERDHATATLQPLTKELAGQLMVDLQHGGFSYFSNGLVWTARQRCKFLSGKLLSELVEK